MNERVTALVRQLGLRPHPEGGYFREFHRSAEIVQRASGQRRAALTAIHYLLASGQKSRWHRVTSDEQWTFLDGDPLDLMVAKPDGGGVTVIRLGPFSHGGEPVTVVPAGHWQAARSAGAYTLASCTVGPGFDFEDFQFLADNSEALKRVGPTLGEARSML